MVGTKHVVITWENDIKVSDTVHHMVQRVVANNPVRNWIVARDCVQAWQPAAAHANVSDCMLGFKYGV